MRVGEAKKIIADIPGQLRKLMEGHHDQESVQPENDGVGVWISDWTRTKSVTRRPCFESTYRANTLNPTAIAAAQPKA